MGHGFPSQARTGKKHEKKGVGSVTGRVNFGQRILKFLRCPPTHSLMCKMLHEQRSETTDFSKCHLENLFGEHSTGEQRCWRVFKTSERSCSAALSEMTLVALHNISTRDGLNNKKESTYSLTSSDPTSDARTRGKAFLVSVKPKNLNCRACNNASIFFKEVQLIAPVASNRFPIICIIRGSRKRLALI